MNLVTFYFRLSPSGLPVRFLQRHTVAREQQQLRDARLQKQQHYTNVGLAAIGVLLAALPLF